MYLPSKCRASAASSYQPPIYPHKSFTTSVYDAYISDAHAYTALYTVLILDLDPETCMCLGCVWKLLRTTEQTNKAILGVALYADIPPCTCWVRHRRGCVSEPSTSRGRGGPVSGFLCSLALYNLQHLDPASVSHGEWTDTLEACLPCF